MVDSLTRIDHRLFLFVPMEKMKITSKSLIGFVDEIETAKRNGWKVIETRVEYVAELIKVEAPRLEFKIGPVSNRIMKD